MIGISYRSGSIMTALKYCSDTQRRDALSLMRVVGGDGVGLIRVIDRLSTFPRSEVYAFFDHAQGRNGKARKEGKEREKEERDR